MMRCVPPKAWMDTLGDGARVLIVDTGFCASTPFVFPQQVRSFIGRADPSSVDGHGECVAQVMASQDPINFGVAPACELYIAQAIGEPHSWSSLLLALDWAKDLAVDVVNMSFAFASHNDSLAARLDDLASRGTILVASYNEHLAMPHSHPAVISVGGLGCVRADICTAAAHHPAILQAGKPFRGTSAAAARIAGVAACAKAYDRSISREDFLSRVSQAA